MTNHELIANRIQALRGWMAEQNLDALIIPHDDDHLGEYLPAEAERLAWATGFTGSAGVAVLLADTAALFVDGRYTLQARQQAPEALFQHLHLIEQPHVEWLAEQLDRHQRVAIDPRLHSYSGYQKMKALLAQKEIELACLEENPIDAMWQDRPAPSKADVMMYDIAYTGQSSEAKREAIAGRLRQQGLDAALLTQSESINWLLNVRGRDIPCFPVVLCYAVIYSNVSVDFFVDTDKLDCNAFSQHVGNDVSVYPLEKLGDVLHRIGEDKLKILVDGDTSNAWSLRLLKSSGATLVQGQDPCTLPKACKNAVELEGMRLAHQKDAVAMCRFLAWLDRQVEKHTEGDEGTLADQLQRFREEQEHFVEPSFDSISALGPNAAMCHYHHTNGTPRALGQDGIYLIDSGGQYLEGTTDITRTVKVGEVDDDVKRQFTRVLKGHIAIDRVRFPKGTSGIQLDVLARLPLWQAGYNYDHGTGHGVGHFLSVHEGPQRIASKGSLVPLEPGMVLSNEPGYYREGAFGIRCENLVVVEPSEEPSEITMYRFRRLTLVPFDVRLIDKSLLSEDEIVWINSYHAEVREAVKAHLSDHEIGWLLQATAPI
ncbi:aminopeptidase P family protein [Pseudaeromonas sharmana]|uniref:Aminopeptidase P family protein n=1 Tax=Pseudaeromonas sharmana TaxID=328412 RepID=A0ABV8CNM3_9GAMM